MHLSAWTDSWVDFPVDETLFHEKLKEKIAGSKYKKPATEKTSSTEGTFH